VAVQCRNSRTAADERAACWLCASGSMRRVMPYRPSVGHRNRHASWWEVGPNLPTNEADERPAVPSGALPIVMLPVRPSARDLLWPLLRLDRLEQVSRAACEETAGGWCR
jgi:hypothetical protein